MKHKAWAIKISKESRELYKIFFDRREAIIEKNHPGWRDPVFVVPLLITELKPKRVKRSNHTA